MEWRIYMSKLYNQYLELKKKNKKCCYLFHSGIFYLFIAEDAMSISSILGLKLTKLTNQIKKCGFPENSLSHYEKLLMENNIDYQKIELPKKNHISPKKHKENRKKQLSINMIQYLNNIDISKITPLDALNLLADLKEMLYYEQK